MMAIRKWGNQNTVNATTIGNQQAPAIAALSGGGFVVAWVDDDFATTDIRFQRYDAFGQKLGAEAELQDYGPVSGPVSIAALSNGGFVVAGSQDIAGNRHATFVAFDSSGVPLSTGASSQTQPSVLPSNAFVAGEDANFTVVNRSVAGAFPQLMRLNASGVTLATEQLAGNLVLPEFYEFNNMVYQPRSSPTSTFDGLAVYGYYDTGGNISRLVAESMEANAGNVASTIDSYFGSAVYENIDLVQLNSFWAVLTYHRVTSGGLMDAKFIKVISNAATFLPIEVAGIDLANLIPGSQAVTEFSIARVDQNTVMLTWEASSSAQPGMKDIVVAMLDIDMLTGAISAAGFEPTVISTVSSLAYLPEITPLADGRLLVVWQDDNALDGDGRSIQQQIIDPRNGIVNGSNIISQAETLFGNDSYNDEMNGFAGNDTMYGLAGADVMYGGDGNDTLYGGRGDDTLYGGSGNDNMVGGAGADEFYGGAGIDIANYTDAKLAVTVALDGSVASLGDAIDDFFVDIENVNGSRFNDVLIGNASNNSIVGNGGADTLNGKDGNDTLRGGTGADTMTGGAGNDSFYYTGQNEGGDIITDFSSSAAGNNDRFLFTGSAFGFGPAHPFTAASFQSDISHTANTTDVRIFFETDTGILRFDADGSTGTINPIILATLQTGATVSFGDIVIL